MFQQKKKYYRIPLHVMDRDRDEQSLWQAFNGDLDGLSTFLVALNDLKTSGVKLSPYSINILMLETVEEQLQFFEAAKNLPPALQDNATCFSNICTYQEGFGALTQLVVGTEAAWLIILNELGNDYAMQVACADVVPTQRHAVQDRHERSAVQRLLYLRAGAQQQAHPLC